MNSMACVFLIACLAAPSLAQWASQGNYAQVPANIALSQDGRNVLDTPEVAQARAAHLAALAQAKSSAGNSNDDGSYDPRWESESNYIAEQPRAQQWNAAPVQEWNAAPAQQWNAAPAQQWNAAPAQQWNSGAKDWRNAPANIALSADGKFVLDTPEVANARAAHLAAYSNLQAAAPAPAQQWNAAPAQQWNAAPAQQWNSAPAQQWNAAPKWNSAAAAPAWNAAAPAWNAAAPAPVADTPEVAQAKAAHAAALAAAQQNAGPSSWNGAPSWQAAPAKSWSAAPSQIQLSQNGQNVLDTPEVAQARAAHLAAHAAAASGAAPAHRNW